MGVYKSEAGKEKLQQHYEDYLHTLNFQVERRYVDTSFGKTHMLVAGPTDGKPLFIFQGGNCINPMTLSWFEPLIEKYRVYAPDTIGHPGFSDETRVSAKDDSFAKWIKELMDAVGVERCAMVGASYGAGIMMRMATFLPERIDCAVLVSPAGIRMGSKLKMIKDVLVPMMLFTRTSDRKHLDKLTGNMSDHSMKDQDKTIIGDVFNHVKLDQDMPKMTEKKELENFHAPTLIIAGEKDVFFPHHKLEAASNSIFSELKQFRSYEMGHFPSDTHLVEINQEIEAFLAEHY
ncbi:alpha/beta fold hydrolase [Thalassobacillus hwangdonensis]|uniref:Alpha/beta fold hydrolase n=1 Tax=Thalassobacillus hwangdonensis TaxID=546108 RepID=A0ABW3L280_9BACI